MKRKIRALIVYILTCTLGRWLVYVNPKKATELIEKGITNLRDTSRLNWKEKLMRRAILRKAKKKGDVKSLEKFHRNYWINHGHDFFSSTENRMKNDYLPKYKATFDILEKELLKDPKKYTAIVEIGTGDGSILNFLSEKFPQINRMVGIDLSEIQIAKNKIKYIENTRLEFVAADGFEWVEENGLTNMVFVTFRGVLEYFTEQRLQDFFHKLNSIGKTTFFAVEPNGLDHDFSINPNSQIYGNECAFSHNYVKLFQNAGFSIWHQSQKIEGEHPDITSIIGAKNF
ncbi:class I SAM-dependent methyltransferase [Maribacter thermophilus]|uniref:class I SAM-dependent methyltransferase n=1 Tax=Maribacter thermophilus TaxID=1197874 RepID=UPI0006413644|nr:class I SAM-dependent methyltransferase [Maribacter thermophilus]